jgi:tRNA (guanine37-N1)-methyltransferase
MADEIDDSNTMLSLRPPLHRSMRVLDRALFSKTIPLAAARVLDNKRISKLRLELNNQNLVPRIPRLPSVQPDPEPSIAQKGGKCLILNESVKPQGRSGMNDWGDRETWSNFATEKSTWPSILSELVEAKEIGIVPYNLDIDYKYWKYGREGFSIAIP